MTKDDKPGGGGLSDKRPERQPQPSGDRKMKYTPGKLSGTLREYKTAHPPLPEE